MTDQFAAEANDRPIQVVSSRRRLLGLCSPGRSMPRLARASQRHGCSPGFSATRAGLAALACLALVSFAAPAQAQAQTTLVSNYESRASGSSQIVGDNNVTNHWVQAQGFTTGSNTGGYTLNSAKFNVFAHDGVQVPWGG